jgi:uncharacterized membrane protein YozB (DUF420 family)
MQWLVGARTASDINLIAQLFILVGLYYGFALARQRRFAQHATVQTAMVLLNVPLIAFMMIPSFWDYVVVGGHTTSPGARLTIAHGALGFFVEVVALYLIVQMRTNAVPRRFRIDNLKLAMRTTLALWTVVFVMGLGIYVTAYVLPSAPTGAVQQGRVDPPAVSRAEPRTQSRRMTPGPLTFPRTEEHDAGHD